MAVPSTNVGLSDIQTEFGGSNPISLSEYYSGGPLVPSGSPAPNGPIPSSGQIAIGQFRCAVAAEFVAATGGTIVTCGNYKIHTFTGPGTFTVTNAGNAGGSNAVDYMVQAGGGGGGNNFGGGGGGAGGFRESVPSPAAWTGSPRAASGGALPVSVTGYPITVGGGGSSSASGSNSVFSTITSNGGGAGGDNPGGPGSNGGSGGGASGQPAGTGGSGNTPSRTPSQGENGGNGSGPTPYAGSAGGGGGGVLNAGTAGFGGGGCYPAPASVGGDGAGTAIAPSCYGTPGPSAPLRYYGGGGGGTTSDCHPSTPSPATRKGPSVGGGGIGGKSDQAPQPSGLRNGATNTGGGAGGAGGYCYSCGGSGGSGIVHIRYKFQ